MKMVTKNKKAYIYTNGCHRRLLDAKRLSNYLIANEYEIVSNPIAADLIMMVLCSFKKEQYDVSTKTIEQFQKYGKKMIVGGCLPGMHPNDLTEIFDGPFFTPPTMDKIDDIIEAKVKLKNIEDANCLSSPKDTFIQNIRYFFSLLRLNKASSTYTLSNNIFCVNKPFSFLIGRIHSHLSGDGYFLTIENGCLGNCSYCGIKKATGSLKSKPPEKCLGEFRQGLKQGFKNFIISGEDPGAYGIDIGQTFPDLLEKFLEEKGDWKITIMDLNPHWLILYQKELLGLFRSGRIALITVPVQSGSDRILKLMNRGYTVHDMEATFSKFRTIKNLLIATTIMVGFPGETEEDVDKTVELLRKLKLDNFIVYMYTDIPGTVSANFSEKIAPDIKKARFKRVRKMK